MATKPVSWLANSLRVVQDFPEPARQDLGFQLYRVQQGLEPSDWKPMPGVGPGVAELRVHAGGAFRLIYIAKFNEAIYVLHAFQKKSQKTPQADLGLARQRYLALLAGRREGRDQ